MGRRRARAGDGARPIAEADPFAVPAHHFPQIWLLFVSLAALGLAVLHAERLLGPVFALDRSHVTALIAALVAAGSVHAAWHVVRYSRRIEAARAALDDAAATARLEASGDADDAFVAAWARDAAPAARVAGHGTDGDARTSTDAAREDLIELYADRLRSPVELGWFLVDVTVRLGLLGTIIGFILIFGSLSGVSIEGAEGLRELLVAMSGGMGTALFTTLAGLVGATILSVQYLILGREAEHLLGLLARYRAGLVREVGAGRDDAESLDDARAALARAGIERGATKRLASERAAARADGDGSGGGDAGHHGDQHGSGSDAAADVDAEGGGGSAADGGVEPGAEGHGDRPETR